MDNRASRRRGQPRRGSVLNLTTSAAAALTLVVLLLSENSVLNSRVRGFAITRIHPSFSTSLHARKTQSPRFSQNVHKKPKKKRRNAGANKGKAVGDKKGQKLSISTSEAWFNGKSIEELESSMSKKFKDTKAGGSRPFGKNQIYDDDDDDDYIIINEDDDEFDDDEFVLEEEPRSLGLSMRPKVYDPWLDDDESGSRQTGNEYNPARPNKATSAAETGYFFNKNPRPTETAVAADTADPEPSQRTNKRAVKDEDDSEVDQKKRSKSKVTTVPVLDENGEPFLLTTDEALRQFHAPSAHSDDGIESYDEGVLDFDAITGRAKSSWVDLGITSEILLENLDAMDCPSPLLVQDKACGPILDTNNDVLVGTYTGSGKTLAFMVPIMQRLLQAYEEEHGEIPYDDDEEDDDVPAHKKKKKPKFHNGNVAAIIVAPGRELASQIVSVARELAEGVSGLNVQLAIGGTTVARNVEQIRKLRPAIVVGTPGRIAELIMGKPGDKSGKMKISSVETLVMDEFDALLQYKAHREPTEAIMFSLKRQKRESLQSVLCSATATDMADSPQIKEFLRPGYITAMADIDDILVTKSKDATTTRVSRTVLHGVVHVPQQRLALETIRRILHTEPIPQQILIFVENSHKVEVVVQKLADMNIIAAPLHGGRGSDKVDRAQVSKALREGYVGIVVATELAARGLDAPLLTHVINLDLPTDASHYAHRAGRCGRGGRPGVVLNLTTSYQNRNVPQRFAESLGVDLHTVEARSGKLMVVEKPEE